MPIWEIILLGLALSMDAFAVSISDGMSMPRISIPHALTISGTFGIYQAIMPTIGYFCCSFFQKQIESIDHWIALILLCFLGIKAIIDSIKEIKTHKDESSPSENSVYTLTFKTLMIQGIATSIDALAVGISLVAIAVPIYKAALIIGCTTCIVCTPAVFLGKHTGVLLGEKAQIVGGSILIAIGIKIFIEHMWF
ncbi:MAG: manganese efflux pump MntP family protein [Treponema sp.]|nr:manganese efflux pump MntP family protein [Treponema sp.]